MGEGGDVWGGDEVNWKYVCFQRYDSLRSWMTHLKQRGGGGGGEGEGLGAGEEGDWDLHLNFALPPANFKLNLPIISLNFFY